MLDNKRFFLFLSVILVFTYTSHRCFSENLPHLENNQRVYLASFPHSGNHWCRYLVESASGIATGAVYIDIKPPHMDTPFPWGGYCAKNGYKGNCRYPNENESVLIKTHYPAQNKLTEFDGLPYKKTIVLVRNPVDCFYSRCQKKYKIKTVSSGVIKRFIKDYRRFISYWEKKENVFFIRYEDMMNEPTRELTKICNILNYELTQDQIQKAVDENPPEGEIYKHIEKYTKEDLKRIKNKLRDILKKFDYEIPI